MELTKTDAEIIVEMERVCVGEGIGPDTDNLLRRIMLAFGDEIVPEHLRPASKAKGDV